MPQMLCRGHARAVTAALLAASLSTGALVATSGSAVASESSDRAQISKLETQIANDGTKIQSLVARQNAVQAHLDSVNVQIGRDQKQLDADKAAEDAALAVVRKVAIRAYMTGSAMDSPTMQIFSGTSDITQMLQQSTYLGAVNSKMSTALMALRDQQDRTRADRDTLQSEQDQAKSSLKQLASARHDAEAVIASDQAMLTHVKGDLNAIVAAAAARQKAEQLAAERALALSQIARAAPPATFAPATFTPSPAPPTVPISAPVGGGSPPPRSVNGYANPLRGIGGLVPERIDQGVDYAGFGPIYAIGNGVVLTTSVPGWPGGNTYIAYRLLDGPAAGLVVFAAEDIQPLVSPGQTVNANTVLGQVYAGPDGIETGWGDPSRLGDTMARTYHQFGGGNSTAFGANFSQLLQSLGAPGGILQGGISGSLPAGWPTW